MAVNIDAEIDPARQTREVVRRLKKEYPEVTCALNHSNALELLIATILSAQCTDARVNIVTADLFRKYRSVEDFANAPLSELERDIHSTGFYRQKAKSIQGAARMIIEKFGGQVPETLEELTTLPGAARKTANVVLGVAFGKASGVVVDTHVSRLSQRLGLTKEKTPERIEADLMRILPRREWIDFSHRLIAHGRQVCEARRPRCGVCVLANICPSAMIEA
jgi:endonuclease-3